MKDYLIDLKYRYNPQVGVYPSENEMPYTWCIDYFGNDGDSEFWKYISRDGYIFKNKEEALWFWVVWG